VTDFIPLSQPDITEDDIEAVVHTLRSGRLALGPRGEAFEQMVAERAGRQYGVAVSSGTAGLHLSLLALGVGPGDEVLTPAFSFVASATCIEYVGAKPVFIDCDPGSLAMNLDHVEAAITERTKAIIGVEVFGNPVGMPELAALCRKHEIPLVEDACEGLGGSIRGEPVGKFGRVAVFGFYPNKQITTGEGGVIVTDDDRLASVCRSLRNHGRPSGPMGGIAPDRLAEPRALGGMAGSDEEGEQEPPELGSWLQHERIGWNLRLSELNAALGVSQMRRLDELLEARDQVANAYIRRLGGHADLILPTVDSSVRMSWFVFVLRLTDRFTESDRDTIITGLRRHDVGASNYFPPIPLMPAFRRKYGYKPGDFPLAESVGHRTIALPFHPRLPERDVDLVCQTLELMMTRVTFARS